MISQKRKFQIYQHFTLLLILHDKITILNITYIDFEISAKYDSPPDYKGSQGQFTDNFRYFSGFPHRAFKQGSQGLSIWSKGVLDYDSGICCFKEVKTTAKILIILAF